MENSTVAALAVGLAGAAVGFALGFRYGVKKTGEAAQIAVENEIKAAREFYEGLYESRVKRTTVSVDEVAAALPATKHVITSYNRVTKQETTAPFIPDVPRDEELLPLDVDPRTIPGVEPYLITDHEFTDSLGFVQITLYYFEGDGVLVDDQDVPIDDSNYILGDQNLTAWGLISGDENTIFIKNKMNDTVYQVIRHPGTFIDAQSGYPSGAIENVK